MHLMHIWQLHYIYLFLAYSDSSPMKCSQPSPIIHHAMKVDHQCDNCYVQGQVEYSVGLVCFLETCPFMSETCTLRNPDGITSQKLAKFPSITAKHSQPLYIDQHLLNNPVDFPASPTLQGVWTCTCRTEEGNFSASIIVARCCEL